MIDKKNNDKKSHEEKEDNKISLLETVAEYEAKQASIHSTPTIQGDTSTGEENEITKFEVGLFELTYRIVSFSMIE